MSPPLVPLVPLHSLISQIDSLTHQATRPLHLQREPWCFFLIWLYSFRVTSRLSHKSREHRETHVPFLWAIVNRVDSILGATQPEMDTTTALCTLRIDMGEELDRVKLSFLWYTAASINITIFRLFETTGWVAFSKYKCGWRAVERTSLCETSFIMYVSHD